MKILSKFRDYYDSVSHQYLDKEIMYLRAQSTHKLMSREFPRLHNFDVRYSVHGEINDRSKYFSLRIVGFCGKLYPVVLASDSHEFDPKNTVGFYDIDDFNKYIAGSGIFIKESKSRRNRWYNFYSYRGDLADIIHFFENRENYGKLDGFFSNYNTPCFALCMVNQEYTLLINPLLKKYSFFKQKDPFNAHQELYQFVGGFLKQPINPMVEISDKDKIHKHGFDKWSFRQKGPKK